MKKKKEKDIWFRMKYMGYCLSNMPVLDETWEVKDYYRMVRFQLAKRWGVSMKNPVFNEYRDEELVVEYFAHRCDEEPEFKESIEHVLNGTLPEYEDAVGWIEEQEEKNKAAIAEYVAKKAKEKELESGKIEGELEEDGFSFKPGDVE